jgi:hypothetical protein
VIQLTIFKGGYMETKLCFSCVQHKPTSCFHKSKKEKDGFQYHCIDCSKKYHAKRYVEQKDKLKVQFKKYKEENKEKLEATSLLWKKNNPDKVKQYQRTSNLRKNFGLSVDAYEQMLAKQNNLCAICEKPETFIHHQTKEPARLAVDHCHKTNKVRKLLCKSCNNALGLFKEDIGAMENAVQYLKDHNG